jgi:hypothetical protein
MGSKSRLVQRLRQNHAFKAETQYLEGKGLSFTVNHATGKGHPFILITMPCGKVVKFHVASSPKQRVPAQRSVSSLRRALSKAGYDYD